MPARSLQILAWVLGLISIGIGFAAGKWHDPIAALVAGKSTASSTVSIAPVLSAAEPDSFWNQSLPRIEKLPPYKHAAKIGDALLDVKPEEAQDLLKRLPSNLSREDRIVWISGLLAIWARKDPEAAVRAAAGYSEFSGNNEYLKSTLVSQWAKQNPDAAIAYARSLPKGNQRQSSLQSAFSGLASIDPNRALDLAEKSEPGDMQDWGLANIYSQFAIKDPQGALRRAMMRKDTGENDQVMMNLSMTWASRDLNGARAALAGMPPGRQRDEMALGVLSVWLKDEPEAAGRYAATLLPKTADYNNPLVRNSYRLSNGWGDDEEGKNIKLFADQLPDGQVKDNLISNWWSSRFQQNPDEAWNELMRQPAGEKRNNQIASALQNLSHQNLPEAFRYASQLTGEERLKAETSIVRQLSYQDPKEAIAFALKSSNEKIQQAVYGSVGWQLGNMPSDEAGALLAQIPEAQRLQPVTGYLGRLARQNSEEAFAYLEKNVSLDKRATIIQQTAANLEPPQALWWLSHLDESEQKSNGLQNVASNWARNDSEAVSTWLATLPASASRDAAVRGFVQQAIEYDAPAATQWAATISDETQLKSGVLTAWRKWKQQNPQAALAWASATQLPDSVKNELKP